MKKTVAGVEIPDGAMAQAATDLIRSTESELMFHHASRAFLFAALTGRRENRTFDAELLYVGAMFHNVGLSAKYHRSPYRFEVDGANAARDFLRQHGIAEDEVEEVWAGIALHTTPGIPTISQRWSRSSMPACRWMCVASATTNLPRSSATRSCRPIHANRVSRRNCSKRTLAAWSIVRKRPSVR